MGDIVIHPDHYQRGTFEPWDVIQDWGLNFDLGNVVKYIVRAGDKQGESALDDLHKAANYLQHHIKYIETNERMANGND